jgi:dihydroorotate dehydrogenase (fumarate)
LVGFGVNYKNKVDAMADLSTTYLGLKLRTPLVPSASILSIDLENVRRMEQLGAPAVVLYSLFEEQLRLEEYELAKALNQGIDSFPEALTYFPKLASYGVGSGRYLKHIEECKKSVKIPVIASLNGSTPGGWTSYAKKIESAGADALELNIYSIPTDPNKSGASVEDETIDLFKAVKASIKIPLAVKLSPYYSNMANMAKRFADAGADGLVLFNRFYQPDLDIEEKEVVSRALLSTSMSLRLPLRWTAILYGKVKTSLAATSGVHQGEDALKMIMAGSDVTMLCSTLLKNGIEHLQKIEADMAKWMDDHEYESVGQMKGSLSQMKCPDASSFERAQYLQTLKSFKPDRGFFGTATDEMWEV